MIGTVVAPARTEFGRAAVALTFTTILWGAAFPLIKLNNLLLEEHQRMLWAAISVQPPVLI